MNSLTLSFNEVNLNPTTKDNQLWLTSTELASALGYKNTKSVTNLYNANSDEFTDKMTLVIESVTKGFGNGNSKKPVRIFSLRGCHLIAMFARTKVAKDFRKWVLDILDREVGSPKVVTELSPEQTLPLRNAVNSLVTKAGMLYPDAYKMIHQRFNVNSIKRLKPEDVEQAVEYIHSLTLISASNAKSSNNQDYQNSIRLLGLTKVKEINHAVGVAEKELYKLEQSLESLATSIEVIKTHNETNYSVFKSLEAPSISIR